MVSWVTGLRSSECVALIHKLASTEFRLNLRKGFQYVLVPVAVWLCDSFFGWIIVGSASCGLESLFGLMTEVICIPWVFGYVNSLNYDIFRSGRLFCRVQIYMWWQCILAMCEKLVYILCWQWQVTYHHMFIIGRLDRQVCDLLSIFPFLLSSFSKVTHSLHNSSWLSEMCNFSFVQANHIL
jgi:hypothetical protein